MPDDPSRTTIGEFLLRRFREAGVTHLFGVPGDFNLGLMQQLEDAGDPVWVGTCNELNGAYAADGYARLNGLGAVVVTHGVGALSAINGVAGAYSEHVPLICVTGSLPRVVSDRGLLMHHSFADGSQNAFLRAFAEVTAAQAQLTPQNAVREIDRLLDTAWRLKLPVYMEVPSDISYLEVPAPEGPIDMSLPASDRERLRSASGAVVRRLAEAQRPAIVVDLDADRFGVGDLVTALSDLRGIPVATVNTAKGVIDEEHPTFCGSYPGSPTAREIVENSDCAVAIGYRNIDSTTGFFASRLPQNTIDVRAYSVDVNGVNYQAVTLRDLLAEVVRMLPATAIASRAAYPAPTAEQSPPDEEGRLTQSALWRAVQGFLREGDVIIAEDGTAVAGCGGLRLPRGCTFVTQAVWGSIGYTVGSLLGTLIAAPERRHLLFVGDGSFQLTAQELSTILRHDLKPVIFLINNRGYTIERTILGKDARYNDVANWNYAGLPEVLKPSGNARSFVVETADELDHALTTHHDGLVFIELRMDMFDAPADLVRGGHKSAALDYGPRGPQARPGTEI
ncbi:alpha-keto acid decarboxylase family protein [Streptomyces sp. NPDC002306]